MALEVDEHPGEVLPPEALQQLDLVAEAGEPVLEAVGKRGEREPAIAAARPAADRVGLEQHHLPGRVVGLRVERRPEPGEAAADDAEVGGGLAAQGRGRLAGRQLGEPERPRLGVGVGSPLGVGDRGEGPWCGHDSLYPDAPTSFTASDIHRVLHAGEGPAVTIPLGSEARPRALSPADGPPGEPVG